jgi:hypothetical protein
LALVFRVLLSIALPLMFASAARGQSQGATVRNSVYLELLGNGGLYSINYSDLSESTGSTAVARSAGT